MGARETGSAKIVPAADGALRILTLLSTHGGPMRASRIAAELSLPRSTTYDLLETLKNQGYIIHFREARRFGLGMAAFELSSGYSRQEPLVRMGKPLLEQLVDRIGESAHLAVLHGADVLYIAEERARHRPSLVTDVGVRLPSNLTASGRAILAWLPINQVRATFPYPAAMPVRHGSTNSRDLNSLLVELGHTRESGFAVESGEVTAGLASVAMPVFDGTGWPIASMAVTFVSAQNDDDSFSRFRRQLEPFVKELSRRLTPA